MTKPHFASSQHQVIVRNHNTGSQTIRIVPVDRSRMVYQISDDELSAFIQQYANSVLGTVDSSLPQSSAFVKQTEIDLQRSNCFITKGGDVKWGLPHRNHQALERLGFTFTPDTNNASVKTSSEILASFKHFMLKENVNSQLHDYLLCSLNQEVLFKTDQFYSHYRASMVEHAATKSNDFFQQRLQFVRHLDISNPNQIMLTMHAFTQSQHALTHLAESTYSIGCNPFNEVMVKCVSHRFHDVSTLLDCPQSRLDTFLSLVKYKF